jgi:hypothetical protein
MYGAALLYNLLLAEHARNADLIAEHRERGDAWAVELDAIAADLADWSLDWVPLLAVDQQQVVSPATLDFCHRWLELVRATGGRLLDSAEARALVRSRELRLKGARSRFTNRRALDQWSGYAGLFRMSYRWPTVRRFLADLHDGLSEGKV